MTGIDDRKSFWPPRWGDGRTDEPAGRPHSAAQDHAQENMRRWIRERSVEKNGKSGGRPGHICADKIKKAANVEHILQAVEPSYEKKDRPQFVPKHVNRRRLRNDLSNLSRHFAIRSRLDDKAAAGRRQKRAFQISRAATDLLGRIEDADGQYVFDRFEASGFPPDVYLDATSLPTLLRALIRAADAETTASNEYGPAVMRFDRSPAVWLIGHRLPEIYERWFRRPAGVARAHDAYTGETGEASGPFLRFADAVLRDMAVHGRQGEPFRPETIATYYREAGGIPRRLLKR